MMTKIKAFYPNTMPSKAHLGMSRPKPPAQNRARCTGCGSWGDMGSECECGEERLSQQPDNIVAKMDRAARRK